MECGFLPDFALGGWRKICRMMGGVRRWRSVQNDGEGGEIYTGLEMCTRTKGGGVIE
jgi:hypothetical protein